MRHRVSRVVRTPAFGIAVITPVVLAGAAAASPGRPAGLAASAPPAAAQSAEQPAEFQGAAVVAVAKTPTNLRFAGTMLAAPPPPAAVVNAVGGMRIPGMALSAYRQAEQKMAATAPGCGISWNLLAAIGRIESSHANGGATDSRGTAIRPIYGPVLDGSLPGNEIIVQSNQGGRAVYARAMGPMQFLPGTWSRYASDGDGDGRADPQNLFDASLSAARYLCSGGLNLRNQSQALTAILRYNNSMAYAQNVLGWASAYATGVAPVDLPMISGPIPALGSPHHTAIEGLPELGPGMHGVPDPRNRLSMLEQGTTTVAGQLTVPGPGAGPEALPSEHGCQVICMASQLPQQTASAQNLPPWMMPGGLPPWMQGPAEPAPLGAPPGPVAAAPAPAAPPAEAVPAAPVPGPPGLPGMPPPPGLPGMPPPPGAPPAMPPAPGTPPWMAPAAPLPPPAPEPVPQPVPGPGPTLPPVYGALPGPAS